MKGETSEKGVYTAVDVTTVPCKQIVIPMGEGANAALAAFEYLDGEPIRGNGKTGSLGPLAELYCRRTALFALPHNISEAGVIAAAARIRDSESE